eukprot:689078_1
MYFVIIVYLFVPRQETETRNETIVMFVIFQCVRTSLIGNFMSLWMYHIICGSGQCLHDPLALYEAIYIVKQQEVRQEDGKGNDTEDTFELGKGKRIMFDVGYCNQCNVTIVVHGISR